MTSLWWLQRLRVGDTNEKFGGDWILYMMKLCNISSSRNVTQILSCLDFLTFEKEEFIFGTQIYSYRNNSFRNLSTVWETQYNPYFGKCQMSRNLGPVSEGESIKVVLNKTLEYRIFIYDPNFFYPSLNPKTTPRIHLSVRSTSLLFLHTEKISSQDRKQSPCTDYGTQGYTFSECIVKYIVKQTGCKVDMNFPNGRFIVIISRFLIFRFTGITIWQMGMRIVQHWNNSRNISIFGSDWLGTWH